MLAPILFAVGLVQWADATLNLNGIEYIRCPEECRCHLYATDCSNLNLTSIPNEIDTKVQVCDLSGNNLKNIHFPTKLQSLQEVNLSNSSLQTITFENLPELTNIDLSQNELTNFSAQQLGKLQSLNLSHNRGLELKSIDDGSISDTLTILDMSACHVKSLKFLNTLPNLQQLILKKNLVKDISSGKSTTLTHLNVREGRIAELNINIILMNYPKLLFLDVSDNRDIHIQLSSINKTEYCLPLEHFAAARTGISEIKVNTLCELQVADFSSNGINIEKSTFRNNIQLKTLNISFNEIKSIHHNAFKSNQKLLGLDLTRNLLENGVWTEHLIGLRSLNLSSNKLITLDDLKMPNLLYLDASDNKITNISRNLAMIFPKLEYLDLSKNLIDGVRPIGIISLKTLILKYCQILLVEKKSFAKMSNLQYLDLTGNKLTRLDYTELSRITSLQTIRLGNNSWFCDCSNDEIKNLYIYIAVNHSLTNTADLVCNEPERRQWKDACGSAWQMGGKTPQSSSLKTAMILLAIFFMTLFFLAGLIYIKHKVKGRIIEEDVVTEQPLNRVSHTGHTSSLRRVQSEVLVRQTTPDDLVDNPPSYEEAIRMPPMTDVERMTRSMDVLVERRMALPTIPE